MSDDRMMMHGRAYSSRERVNVILPGTVGSHGDGNHHYAPARGDVAEYVQACVEHALQCEANIAQRHERKVAQCFATPRNEVTPGPDGRGIAWARQPFTVSVRSDVVERGKYTFTVWG